MLSNHLYRACQIQISKVNPAKLLAVLALLTNCGYGYTASRGAVVDHRGLTMMETGTSRHEIRKDDTMAMNQTDGHEITTLAERPEYIHDQVILKLSRAASHQATLSMKGQQVVQMVATRHGLSKIQPVLEGKQRGPLQLIYCASLPEGVSPAQAVNDLQADPDVEWAEPHYYRYTLETKTNDPNSSSQWHLRQIVAHSAWDSTTGDPNVIIAVIDTGVDWTHPDLENNIWRNTREVGGDGLDNDENGFIDDLYGWDFVCVDPCEVYEGEDPGPPDNNPMDFDGHGTHVAGIAGADGNNGIGVSGICWNVRLMNLRAGYKNTSGRGMLQMISIADALIYAADNGADIINMSFGGHGLSRLEREVIDYCSSAGVLLIAAAGNDSSDRPIYPAGFRNVVAVAATSWHDRRDYYSNYGVWIDIAAPGGYIYSTLIEGSYGYKSGTSMASPIVAGAAALIKSAHPSWSADQITLQLMTTSTGINEHYPQFTNYFVNLLGAGRIALDQAFAATSPAKLGVVSLWSEEEDGDLDPNETVLLLPCLENFGVFQPGVSIHVQTTDPYITILDDYSYVGDIGEKQNVVAWDDGVTIFIDGNTPEDHIASISLEISTGEYGLVAMDVLRLRLNPAISDPYTVAQHPKNFDYVEPKLTTLQDNGLAIVFHSEGRTENQIYARIAHSLDAWGPAVKISDTPVVKAARNHSVAASDNGWLHVCFLGVVASWDAEIFYTAWNPNDGFWIDPVQLTTNAEIFDKEIPRFDSPSTIGVDLQGHPHIVWVDHRHGGTAEFYHIRHDGNNWSEETVVATPPGNALDIWQLHMTFDSKGTGYLLWSQEDDVSIYMTQLTGNDWSSPEWVATTSDITSFSLDLDLQDQLHLTYTAPTKDEVSYQYYDGNTWSDTEVLMDTHMNGPVPAIAIDPDDRPHVARMALPNYSQGQHVTQIYERIHDGTSWSILTPITFDRAGLPMIDLDYIIDDSGTRLMAGALDTNPGGGLHEAHTDIVLFMSNPDPAWRPSRPVVVDGGLITTNPNALEASWSSTHVSGIAEYEYGLGTLPGEADLRYWKSAGTQTSVVEDLTNTPLIPGQSYYINVRAYSAAGYWSSVGSSDGIVYLPDFNGNNGEN